MGKSGAGRTTLEETFLDQSQGDIRSPLLFPQDLKGVGYKGRLHPTYGEQRSKWEFLTSLTASYILGLDQPWESVPCVLKLF